MKYTPISREEAERRRLVVDEADIAAQPILRRLVEEVNNRFGLECARIGDLAYEELTEPVLDYLVSELQSEKNFRVRTIIASVLHEAGRVARTTRSACPCAINSKHRIDQPQHHHKTYTSKTWRSTNANPSEAGPARYEPGRVALTGRE